MATQLNLFDLENYQVIPSGPGEWRLKAKAPAPARQVVSISEAAKFPWLQDVSKRVLQRLVQEGDVEGFRRTGGLVGKWSVYVDSLREWDRKRREN